MDGRWVESHRSAGLPGGSQLSGERCCLQGAGRCEGKGGLCRYLLAHQRDLNKGKMGREREETFSQRPSRKGVKRVSEHPPCSRWDEPASNILHQGRPVFCSPYPADPPGALKAAAFKVLLADASLPSSRADGDKDKHDGEQGGRP